MSEPLLKADTTIGNRDDDVLEPEIASSELEPAVKAARIIDWIFLVYDLIYIPILMAILIADPLRGQANTIIIVALVPAVIAILMELQGTAIKGTHLSYPVRIQLYGPFAFPLFRRTVDLDKVLEATADTKYQYNRRFSDLSKLRIVYLTGSLLQAKIWFSSKGRRDWLFAQLRMVAPHIRQYRGRW